MAPNPKNFPAIPRNHKRDASQDALAESVEVLTGQRGNGDNRALLRSDLVNFDAMRRQALIDNIKRPKSDNGLPSGGSRGIERPHAPLNVIARGGFTFITLSWQSPTYHGHSYTEIWRSETDLYANAIKIATEVTDIFSDSVDMDSRYYYWVRFVNQVDMRGPTQAGGGIVGQTQASAESILNKIEGQIESSHLGEFLSGEIGKIAEISNEISSIDDAIEGVEANIDLVRQEVGAVEESIDTVQSIVDTVTEDVARVKTDVSNFAADILEVKADIVTFSEEITNVKGSIDIFAEEIVDVKEDIEATKTSVEQALVDLTGVQENIGNINTEIDETQASVGGALDDINQLQTDIFEQGGLIDEAHTNAQFAHDHIQSMQNDSDMLARSLIESALIEDRIREQNTLNLVSLSTSIDEQKSDLRQNYYTAITVDAAIAISSLSLKTQIENPQGASLGARLYQDYYSKTDTNSAIAVAGELLQSNIEDPNGNSLGAELQNNYYTKVDTESAISSASNQLHSEFTPVIEATLDNALATDLAIDEQRVIKADLIEQSKTIATNEEASATHFRIIQSQFNNNQAAIQQLNTTVTNEQLATAQAFQSLHSQLGDTNADLSTNYYTKSGTEEVIAEATTALQASIEDPFGTSLGANLVNNYMTGVETGSAISQATQALKSEIEDPEGNSLGATLFTDYQTKVDAEQALSQATSQLHSEFSPVIEATLDNALATDLALEQQRVISADVIEQSRTIATNEASHAQSFRQIQSQFGYAQSSIQQLTDVITTHEQASALISNQLSSEIENTKTNLENNYYTSASTDEAIALSSTELQSNIDTEINQVNANLTNNYHTAATTDAAIAQASTDLQSEFTNDIANLTANISQTYTTQTDTEQAIAQSASNLVSKFTPTIEATLDTALANDLALDQQRLISAEIENQRQTLADAEQANAIDKQVLSAQFADSLARSKQLSSVVAENKKAAALESRELAAEINNVSATLEQDYYTQSTTDAAIAAANTALASSFVPSIEATLEGLVVGDVTQDNQRQIKANLDKQAQTLADMEKAQALELKQLSAQYDHSIAQSEQLSKVMASNEEAAALERLELSTEIDQFNSTLTQDYYTQSSTDSAIAAANTALSSSFIPSIEATLEGLVVGDVTQDNQRLIDAKLEQQAQTFADSEKAQALELKQLHAQFEHSIAKSEQLSKIIATNEEAAALERLALSAEINEFNATLTQDYYTQSTTDAAISASNTALSSSFTPSIEATLESLLIGDVTQDNQRHIDANLEQQSLTFANAEKAKTQALKQLNAKFDDSMARSDQLSKVMTNSQEAAALERLALSAEIDQLNSTLTQDYYTQSTIDEAIALASSELQSNIENEISNVNATLVNSYYTASTIDEAISQASLSLKSEFTNDIASLESDISQTYTTQTDTEQAIAQSASNLISHFTPAIEATLDNALANDLALDEQRAISAEIESQRQTMADAEKASAIEKRALAAQFADSAAKTKQLSSVIAENKEAAALANLELTAEIENVNTTLTEDYYTSSNVDEALALNAEQLSSSFTIPIEATLESLVIGDITQSNQREINALLERQAQTIANAEKAQAIEYKNIEAKFDENKASNQQLSKVLSSQIEAEAQERLQLESEIEQVGATLEQDYYTGTTTDNAIALSHTELSSSFTVPIETTLEGLVINDITQDNQRTISANLEQQNQAIANTEKAQAIEQQQLDAYFQYSHGQAAQLLNVIASDREASATARLDLKAEIENEDGDSVGAALQVLNEAVVENDNNVWALWGVKSTVNDLTSSVGFINDGVTPIFAIKGAKFAVITEQDPDKLTPMFSVVGGKTVMAEALIDEAHIQSLVTDDLLANRVMVGSTFTTPSINYDRGTGARTQNFSLSPNGVMHAKSAELTSIVIKDSSGNVIMSSTGAISANKVTGLGSLALKNTISLSSVTDSGPFAGLSKITSSNVTTYISSGAIGSAQISQAYINTLFGVNATFSGRVYAEKIEGDVYDAIAKRYTGTKTGTGTVTLFSGYVAPYVDYRKLHVGTIGLSCVIDPVSNADAKVSIKLEYWNGSRKIYSTYTIEQTVNNGKKQVEFIFTPQIINIVPSTGNTSFTVKMIVSKSGSHYSNPTTTQPSNSIVSVFLNGGSLS